jgi:hypothetical protein
MEICRTVVDRPCASPCSRTLVPALPALVYRALSYSGPRRCAGRSPCLILPQHMTSLPQPTSAPSRLVECGRPACCGALLGGAPRVSHSLTLLIDLALSRGHGRRLVCRTATPQAACLRCRQWPGTTQPAARWPGAQRQVGVSAGLVQLVPPLGGGVGRAVATRRHERLPRWQS